MASSEKKIRLQNEKDKHTAEQKEIMTDDGPFSHKTWKSDLTFVIEEKELYVSKVILATLSPVFDRMFSSGFREKTTDRMALPDKEYESFLEFLYCIYPGVNKQITEENIYLILPLLHEYQIDSLLSTSENLLRDTIKRDSDIDKIYSSLILAANYQLNKLKNRCIEIASEHDIADVSRAKQDYEIPSAVQEEILTLAVKRLQLDVKDYRILVSQSGELGRLYIPPRAFLDGNRSCGGFTYDSYHSYKSDYPTDRPMDFATRIALITSLRLSKKASDTSEMKLLLKICKDRPIEEMQEMENEDIMKCLSSDLKDFIFGNTSALPPSVMENEDEDNDSRVNAAIYRRVLPLALGQRY